MYESRIERARQFDFYDAADRLGQDFIDVRPSVVSTTTVSYYPTTPKAYYAVVLNDVSGTEIEGSGVILKPTGKPFYAANIGTQIPPEGTPLVIHQISSGRWVFQYNG